MNCLPGIRSDRVRNDDSWHEWEFPQFVTALEKWTQRNPISNNEIKKGIGHHRKEKLLNTKQHQKKYVYFEDTELNSTYCKKVESIAERKKILIEKKVMLQLHWETASSIRLSKQKNMFSLQRKALFFNM